MNMLEVTTRVAREADLPVVLEMIQALAAYHGDESTLTLEFLTQEAREFYTIFVAVRGDDIVGYTVLMPVGQLQFNVRGVEMCQLYVCADQRRGGVGRALINASIEFTRKSRASYLSLGTHPDNKAAAKVYLAAGFDQLPESGPRFRLMVCDEK